MALVITESCQDRLQALMAERDANGCRRWLGAHDEKGYPRFIPYHNSRFSNLVHRMIFQLKAGEEPARYVKIRRTCGNRWCVEPDHITP